MDFLRPLPSFAILAHQRNSEERARRNSKTKLQESFGKNGKTPSFTRGIPLPIKET